MAVRFDPILNKLLQKYIKTTGDTVTGDVIFPLTGYIMTDEAGSGRTFRVTINASGTIKTAEILDYEFQDGTDYTFQDGTSYNLQ